MQILGLVLILINIGAIAAPVTGAVIMYRDNISELIIPPEINQLINDIETLGSEIQLPEFVNYTYDQTAKIVTVIFKFTNPFNLNVTINSIAADIECTEHSISLGHFGISNPVELNKDVTAYIIGVFAWTTVAENHFLTEHVSDSSISISLENIIVDISGITIEAPMSYNIGNIPIP